MGEKETAATKSQVVAEVPAYQFSPGIAAVDFSAFETKASSKGEAVRITFANARTLSVAWNGTELAQVRIIDLVDHCASVDAPASRRVRLCVSNGKIDLEVSQASTTELALHLSRGDALPPPPGEEAVARVYGLDELVGRARFQSYAVAQEAERVYQAREGIKVARGELLPKLSLRAIVGIFTGDYLSVVGSALPFLFPSNWFHWKASKAMFGAERKSFASLKGNQMNTVEGLFYFIQRDQSVLAKVSQHLDWMRKTQAGLRNEEQAGTLPTGEADYYGTQIAVLDRDRIMLEKLVQDEIADLAQGVALPPIGGILSLAAVDAPALDGVQPIRAEDFSKQAQDQSLEVDALNSMLSAAHFLTQDVLFEWLSPDGASSLGFGTAAAFRIGRSREGEIKSKIDETLSLIAQKCSEAASEHNSALQGYALAGSSLGAVQRRLDWLVKRHLSGDTTLDETDFIDQLTDLQNKMLGFKADQLSSAFSWALAESKIQRLTRVGYYADLENGLPTGAR